MAHGPKGGPKRALGIILRDFAAALWAHLGLILGYLGPSLALLGGSRGASYGRFQGCKVAKHRDVKNIKKHVENQRVWPIPGGNKPSERLHNFYLVDVVVVGWGLR